MFYRDCLADSENLARALLAAANDCRKASASHQPLRRIADDLQALGSRMAGIGAERPPSPASLFAALQTALRTAPPDTAQGLRDVTELLRRLSAEAQMLAEAQGAKAPAGCA